MRKLLLVLPFLLTGCVSAAEQVAAVKHRASYDLACNPDKLQITWLQSGTYGAEGCKQRQVYETRGSMVYKEGAAPNPVYVESPVIYGGAGIYRYR